jgi:hypothetical protein
MKINFFKKENNFKKKEFAFKPNLYWKFTLLGTLIIMILSFFFGYYLFEQINREFVLPTATDNGQIPTINTDRIEKVLNIFSEREIKSNQILNSPAPVVDPSL